MTKEQFVEIMTKLKDKFVENEEWFKYADKFAEGITFSIIEHDYLDLLIDTIQYAVGDKDGWVSHYMFNNIRKPEWFDMWDKAGKEHKIDSYEKLYDLIKEEGDFA